MLIARSCARVGGKDVVGEIKGVDLWQFGGRGSCGPRDAEQRTEGRRLRLTLSAEALAMM